MTSQRFLLALLLGSAFEGTLVCQTNVFPASGNVGIGTTQPIFSLTNSPRTSNITDASNVGLAGTNSFVWEHLSTDSNWGYTAAFLNSLSTPYYPNSGLLIEITSPGQGSKLLTLNSEGIDRVSVLANGSVGIGTATPCTSGNVLPANCKLTVNGAIQAAEVVVTSGLTADYVFQPDYRLAPLSEVASFIEANHHLPDIPSAADVEDHGVSLGEMQAKLLAKIEELTLHMIAEEREHHRLEDENHKLQERLAFLEAKVRDRELGNQ